MGSASDAELLISFSEKSCSAGRAPGGPAEEKESPGHGGRRPTRAVSPPWGDDRQPNTELHLKSTHVLVPELAILIWKIVSESAAGKLLSQFQEFIIFRLRFMTRRYSDWVPDNSFILVRDICSCMDRESP